MPSEWSPFFQKDGAFNAIFVDLMTTMFLCLDVEGTNELSPEVWSAFLEMQGVGMENNICRFFFYFTPISSFGPLWLLGGRGLELCGCDLFLLDEARRLI